MRNSHSMSLRSIAVAVIVLVAFAAFVASALGASDINLTMLRITHLQHPNGAHHDSSSTHAVSFDILS